MEPGFIEFKLPSTYLLLEGSCVVAWCTSDGQLSMQVIVIYLLSTCRS